MPQPKLHKIDEGDRFLECRLTDAEKLQYAEDAWNEQIAADREQEKIDGLRAAAKGAIAEHTARYKELMHCVGTGVQRRDVMCHRLADYAKGTLLTVRQDTGETIDERPLTAAELQRKMTFDVEAEHMTDEAVGVRFADFAEDLGDDTGNQGSADDEHSLPSND